MTERELHAIAAELLEALAIALAYAEMAEDDPVYKLECVRKDIRKIRAVIARAESAGIIDEESSRVAKLAKGTE